jgi:hypothetical protein
MKHIIMQLSSYSCYFLPVSLLVPTIPLNNLFQKAFNVLALDQETSFYIYTKQEVKLQLCSF